MGFNRPDECRPAGRVLLTVRFCSCHPLMGGRSLLKDRFRLGAVIQV